VTGKSAEEVVREILAPGPYEASAEEKLP